MVSVSCLAGSMLFVLIFFFKREIFFSRLILLYVWGISTLFFLHFILRFSTFGHNDTDKEKMFFVRFLLGMGRVRFHLRSNCKKAVPDFNQSPHWLLMEEVKKYCNRSSVLGKLDALERVCREERIDAILQTEAPEQTPNLLLFAEGKYLEFLLATSVIGAFRSQFKLEHAGEYSTIRFGLSPLFGWGQIAKRGFDFAFSALVLFFRFSMDSLPEKKKDLYATGPGTDSFENFLCP